MGAEPYTNVDNPFRYTQEMILQAYRVHPNPDNFDGNENITSGVPLSPVTLHQPSVQEQDIRARSSWNPDFARKENIPNTNGVASAAIPSSLGHSGNGGFATNGSALQSNGRFSQAHNHGSYPSSTGFQPQQGRVSRGRQEQWDVHGHSGFGGGDFDSHTAYYGNVAPSLQNYKRPFSGGGVNSGNHFPQDSYNPGASGNAYSRYNAPLLSPTSQQQQQQSRRPNPSNIAYRRRGEEPESWRQPRTQVPQQDYDSTPESAIGQQQQQLATVPYVTDSWTYRDPMGTVQGPFTPKEMQQWHEAGYFAPDLPIKRFLDTDFHFLSAYIEFYGGDPFMRPPMPYMARQPLQAPVRSQYKAEYSQDDVEQNAGLQTASYSRIDNQTVAQQGNENAGFDALFQNAFAAGPNQSSETEKGTAETRFDPFGNTLANRPAVVQHLQDPWATSTDPLSSNAFANNVEAHKDVFDGTTDENAKVSPSSSRQNNRAGANVSSREHSKDGKVTQKDDPSHIAEGQDLLSALLGGDIGGKVWRANNVEKGETEKGSADDSREARLHTSNSWLGSNAGDTSFDFELGGAKDLDLEDLEGDLRSQSLSPERPHENYAMLGDASDSGDAVLPTLEDDRKSSAKRNSKQSSAKSSPEKSRSTSPMPQTEVPKTSLAPWSTAKIGVPNSKLLAEIQREQQEAQELQQRERARQQSQEEDKQKIFTAAVEYRKPTTGWAGIAAKNVPASTFAIPRAVVANPATKVTSDTIITAPQLSSVPHQQQQQSVTQLRTGSTSVAIDTKTKLESNLESNKNPTEDFMRWAKGQLRTLINVNVDDFVALLLTIEDANMITEILSEAVGGSERINVPKFAQEFLRRRKTEAAGAAPYLMRTLRAQPTQQTEQFVTVGKKNRKKREVR